MVKRSNSAFGNFNDDAGAAEDVDYKKIEYDQKFIFKLTRDEATHKLTENDNNYYLIRKNEVVPGKNPEFRLAYKFKNRIIHERIGNKGIDGIEAELVGLLKQKQIISFEL